MMTWQDALKIAQQDMRASPEFLDWLRALVTENNAHRAQIAALDARVTALEEAP